MKKKLLIMFLLFSIALYILSVYLYKTNIFESITSLLTASILLAISSELFRKSNKKTNSIEFKIENVEIRKKKWQLSLFLFIRDKIYAKINNIK